MIQGVVAVDPNYAIGHAGRLPWHYPEDLRHFRATTMGHAIVMGRRTFESLGKPLPGRINLVLSRAGFRAGGAYTVHSVEEALAFPLQPDQDLFVIGGAATYRVFAPWIDAWVVTRIPDPHPEADTFFDPHLLSDFCVTNVQQLGPLYVELLTRQAAMKSR